MMHQPVLCEETLLALQLQNGGLFLDATYGCGGHSQAILNQLSAFSQDRFNFYYRLLAMDQDPAAEKIAVQHSEHSNFQFIAGNFSDADSLIQPYLKQRELFSGVLLDLGVSSPQLDLPMRGFSFMRQGPLDMRMDTSQGMTAAQWLQKISLSELEYVLKAYGEERYARKIAHAIVDHRKRKPLETTAELAELVIKQIGFQEEKHPATRTFQAIRMAVNQEVRALSNGLSAIFPLLRVGARLAVITFHGIEVRILRSFLKRMHHLDTQMHLIEKRVPSPVELKRNPRSRSAILWVLEK